MKLSLSLTILAVCCTLALIIYAAWRIVEGR